jgi:hypothetical protein
MCLSVGDDVSFVHFQSEIVHAMKTLVNRKLLITMKPFQRKQTRRRTELKLSPRNFENADFRIVQNL